MYLLFTGLLILVIGLIIYSKADSNRYDMTWGEFIGAVIFSLGGAIVVFLLVGLLLNHTGIKKQIYTHKMLQEQYNTIRKDSINVIERTTIAKDIIDYNMRLSSEKYGNNNQWDWWTSDKIADLDYIK